MEEPEKWYSTNEEDYQYLEIEDAVGAVFDDLEIKVGDVRSVWEGTAVISKAGDYAPRIVEELSERAYDECGDYAEGWPDYSDEQKRELEAMVAAAVNEWADNHGFQPKFGTVKDVREIKVRLTSEAGEWEYVDPTAASSSRARLGGE